MTLARKHLRNYAGFTLIELMITVAIIAILAGIALPSYNSYLVTTRRADAQRAMIEFAQSLERYYSTNGTYQNSAATACGLSDPSHDYYTITTVCGASTFTITAAGKTGTSQASDSNQTLTNTNARGGTWKK